MESNGNRSHRCSSEHPLTGCRTRNVFNARNLSYMLDENELNWPHKESGRSAAPAIQRTLLRIRGYVNDNLVSLNEQQFVDAVPQRTDEFKSVGHKSLPHFSLNPHSFSCSEQNPTTPQC